MTRASTARRPKTRLWRLAIAMIALAPAVEAYAVDVPVHGRALSLRVAHTDTTRRLARFSLVDDAIRAPFPDPRSGARLVLSGGIRSGQCRVDLAFDASKWEPLSVNGEVDGYRYVDPDGAVAGIRRAVLRPGKLAMVAGLTDWPCALDATTERTPVTVELHVGAVRYCSEFGGVVTHNERRRFGAHNAPAPAACGKRDITAANINVLHGLNCDLATRFCRLNDRSILLFQFVKASGCPDVLTFQEVFRNWLTIINGYQTDACPPIVYDRAHQSTGLGVDDQVILSRFPIVDREIVLLYRDFRSVTFARIDHPTGPLDVFSTHLASSSDGAEEPCADDCPAACVAAGATTVRDCQAVQIAKYVESRHDIADPALITGDLNSPPGSFVYNQFVDRGWTDVYLAAGNPECDPLTGVGCTSGRQDTDLSQLESTESNENERIDFIFAVPPQSVASCLPEIEPTGDPDGDKTSTALFAAESNPFGLEGCGAIPLPICHPSDHQGVQVDLNCASAAQ